MSKSPLLNNWYAAAQTLISGRRQKIPQWTLASILILALAATMAPSRAYSQNDGFGPPVGSGSETRKLWLFGGIDLGYSGLSVDSLRETNKNGVQFNAKALLSYYWTNWVLDGGLGWQYNRVNGGTTPATETTITTRAGFIELSPRWRATEHWQIGPTANFVFGTDMSFAPTVSTNTTVLLAGAQADYELDMTSWRVRLGARALTDLTVASRQVIIAQGLVQVGFPLGGSSYSEPAPVIPAKAEPIAEPLAPAVAPVMGIAPPERGEIAVELGVGRIQFQTASHKLTPKSERALREFGGFLKANDSAWGRLNIDGHTDERGSFDYNLRLSIRRANSVRDALAKGGASKPKMRAGGYSGAYPIVNEHHEAAWAKNRRVELQFFDVTDRPVIADGVEKFEKKLDVNIKR